jgi:hypothetical protein
VLLLPLQDGVTTRQKQEALYGSTAVHATFGDVELAQITLRGTVDRLLVTTLKQMPAQLTSRTMKQTSAALVLSKG